MVEHFALGRQIGGALAERPRDVPRGEHGMRLMQSHIGVGVDPHTACTFAAVDQDDLLIAGQVPARDEKRVEPGDSGANNADVAAFHYPIEAFLSSSSASPVYTARRCRCGSLSRHPTKPKFSVSA